MLNGVVTVKLVCCVEGGVLEKGGTGKLLPWFRPGVLGQVSEGRKRHS